MDFSELEAYVMVCREGKMSRAADRLFMSKQTLSVIIKRIESEMDAELLIRTGSGVEMTAEGECFFEYACQMLSLWRVCGGELEQLKRRRRSMLSVGFGYMVWNLWTKEVGQRFAVTYPNIELKTESDLSKELLNRLDTGEVDVVVTCMQTDRVAQYDCERLKELDVWMTMTQEDPLAQKMYLTPQDLAGRRIVYSDSGADFLRQFCVYLQNVGVSVQSKLFPAGNYLSNLRVVREECALKISNKLYLEAVPEVEGYVHRPVICKGTMQVPRICVCALMRRGKQENPEVHSFVEFLRRLINERV